MEYLTLDVTACRALAPIMTLTKSVESTETPEFAERLWHLV